MRGTLSEVAGHFHEHEPKGEIVILLAGRSTKNKGEEERER